MNETADNSSSEAYARLRRRDGLTFGVASLVTSLLSAAEASARQTEPGSGNDALSSEAGSIRPFRVSFPEAELTELRRRIKLTRWPDHETVADASQGVALATVQALAGYWATPL